MEHVCQYLILRTKVLHVWTPQKVHRFVRLSLIFLLMVHSAKKHSVVTEFSKDSGVSGWVTKSVNVPAYGWGDIEFLLEKLVANHHIVNNVIKMRVSLIIGTPSSVYNFKLLILDKFLDLLLFILRLPLVPHWEESHFCISKIPLFILWQFFNNRVKNILYISMLARHIATRVVLVNSFKPPQIFMRMWN